MCQVCGEGRGGEGREGESLRSNLASFPGRMMTLQYPEINMGNDCSRLMNQAFRQRFHSFVEVSAGKPGFEAPMDVCST